MLVLPILATVLIALLAWAGLQGGTWLHERRVAKARLRASQWAGGTGWICQVSGDGDVTFTEPDAERPVMVHGTFTAGTLYGRVTLATGLPLDARGRLTTPTTVRPRFTGDVELERVVDVKRLEPAALAMMTPEVREQLTELVRVDRTVIRNNNEEIAEPHRVESGTVIRRLRAGSARQVWLETNRLVALREALPPRLPWPGLLAQMALSDPNPGTRERAGRVLCEVSEAEQADLERLAAEAPELPVRAAAARRVADPELVLPLLGHPEVSGDDQARMLDALPQPWPEALLERCARSQLGPVLVRAMKEASLRCDTAQALALEDRLITLLATPQHVDAIRALGDHGSIRAVEPLHELKQRLPWGQPLKQELLDRAITAIQSRAGPSEAGAVSLAVEDLGALSIARPAKNESIAE